LSPSTAQEEKLQRALAHALASQQAGHLAEAATGYETALALAPANFDALHMLGVVRYQQGEFERSLDLLDRALAVNSTAPAARFNRALVQAALDRRPAEDEIARAAEAFALGAESGGEATSPAADALVRVIAFYLPQFHQIAENDAWWGDGFTEWTNVRKARPCFDGHWQPHVPGELGYYDLTASAVRSAQAALARAYGVDAFCYYYYWFGGRRLLEQPLAEVLASGQPDFPFCVCWANENWTRRWDGRDEDVLMRQRYAPEDARALAIDLLPLLRDRRYVRVDGRPLLLVYKVDDIPDASEFVRVWRHVCREAGVGEPYLCAVQRRADDDPTSLGFDAAVEFPPIGHAAENVTERLATPNGAFRGTVFRYANLAAYYLMLPRPPFRQFRGVTPMWDNTPRRPRDGMVVTGSTPAQFGIWLSAALRQTRLRHTGDERLLFINAWNEWAEGNHLEPDLRNGRGYLQALQVARRAQALPLPSRPALATIERDAVEAIASGALRRQTFGPRREPGGDDVSVVMPVYNHAHFLPRALASLAAQTRLPAELIAVDDGSTDDSAAIVETFAAVAPFAVTLVRQANAGADRALNIGLALARAGIVALLNSDDAFEPARLDRLVGGLAVGIDLAFSGCAFVDDDDAASDGAYATELRRRQDETWRAPTLLHVLVRYNAAVSTGNLVFRRALLARTGGFAPLAVCHDWDFVLAATYATRFAVVPDPLYRYRLHDANTFAVRRIAGVMEGEIALAGFFAGVAAHPWLDAHSRRAFLVYARGAGLGGFLPRGSAGA